MTQEKMETGNRITEGVIFKEMLLFCIPIALGMVFQQLYNVVDAVIVGRFLGKQALASVGGSAATLANLVIGFFGGLTSGASVIVSQYFGANNEEGVKKGIHTAYLATLLSGIVLAIIGWFCVPTLLRMMQTPQDTLRDSTIYLRIYFIGLVATLTYNMGSAIMRAIGDSKRPFYYLIVCSIVNIVLDILFVVVFQWGIAGAAVATVLAQLLSTLLTAYSLATAYSQIKLQMRELKIHGKILLEELKVGIPGGVQFCISGITNVMIQTTINSFGTDITAAWAAFNKVDMIYWMVLGSLGTAVTTFAGQNFGAGKIDRVYKTGRTGLVLGLISSVIIQAGLIIFRGGLIGIFTDDLSVIKMGAYMIIFNVPIYIVMVFSENAAGILRGMGFATIPMIINIIALGGFRLPWLFFFVPKHHTIEVVMLSYPIAGVISAILMLTYYFYIKKKQNYTFPLEK